jgi:hypothetical protein
MNSDHIAATSRMRWYDLQEGDQTVPFWSLSDPFLKNNLDNQLQLVGARLKAFCSLLLIPVCVCVIPV